MRNFRVGGGRTALAAILIGSGLATAAGMFALIGFDGKAGSQESAPSEWPEASALPRSSHQPTLLVFAHPECPCTRATLYELSQALSNAGKGVHPLVEVLFVRAADESPEESESWRMAASMGASVRWDDDGVEASRFRARTSGFVLLFDAHGRRIFQGGITASRGHVGSSYGRDRLETALRTGLPVGAGSQVFGCSLKLPGRKG